MKKKILVIGALPPPTGGMETVMEQMVNLKLPDYEIIPFNVAKNNLIKSNILFNLINFIYRCNKLFITLLIEKPDIVHIHVAAGKDFWQKSIYMKISNIFGNKTLLHMHGSTFKEFYRQSKKKIFIRRILDQSKGLLVLSESWKKYYQQLSKVRVSVIQNAIEDIDYKKLYRIYSKDQFVILFTGYICKRKGVYDLLQVIRLIGDSKFRFVFIGPYEDKNFFFNEVDRLGIRDNCEFLGELVGKERFKYFASSNIFILPSYAEGLPISILEAMSFGLPIISTNVGAIPEIITKKSGILVEPGDIKRMARSIRFLFDNKNRNIITIYNKSIINKYHTLKIFKKNLCRIYKNV